MDGVKPVAQSADGFILDEQGRKLVYNVYLDRWIIRSEDNYKPHIVSNADTLPPVVKR